MTTLPSEFDGHRAAARNRHLVTNAAEVPLVARCGPASCHNSVGFETLLDAVPPTRTPARRRRFRPGKLHTDKGYDIPRCRRALRQRGIRSRIARFGVEPRHRLGQRRWLVEQTLALLKQFRRLAVRQERREKNFQALLTICCYVFCPRRLWQTPRL